MIETEIQPLQPKSEMLQVLDYNQLVAEIIKHFRGDLNQRELSTKLGYSFNQVGKWESLATQIKWDDFLNLTAVLNIPVEKHFRDYFFWTREEEFEAESSIKVLFQYVNIDSMGWHRPKSLVDKWLNGTSVPDFSEVLMMMNSKPLVLIGWLSRFFDCSKIPSLQAEYKRIMGTLDAVLSGPYCAIINAVLDLQKYKDLEYHDEELVAKEAGCSVEEVRKSLNFLCEAGTVTFNQKKYVSSCKELSVIRHPKMRLLTKYFTDLAAKRFSSEPPLQVNFANPSISLTRVAALSTEASKKIMDLTIAFHNDVAQVVKTDKGVKDHVRLMVMHNFVSNIHAANPTRPENEK